MLFDVQVTTHAGWSVLAVTGEFDLASVPRVRRAVIDTLAIGNAYLVLDLTGVDFIDSSGLGVVLGSVRRARAIGGDVRVVVQEPQVRAVFEVTGLDRILELYPSVDEALVGVGLEVVDG